MVDVCTGVRLQNSAITDIVGQAVVPVASGVENLVDDLLSVSVVLPPLLNITDVDLEVDDILAGIAAGDPISLQLIDTDGNLVGPSDCNLTSDGYALNNAAGLSIGGNQITGLGDGTAASAGEIDAIAFGNGATTSVGAGGAIAIGSGASVTAANSVALGAGSLVDRGPQAGYTANFLSGTQDSVGSFSVGSAGAYRQITNVAPGSDDNDAATVGQVQAAINSVNASVADAVQYDSATQDVVTLAGTGGTTVTNLADGTVASGSSDAVTGNQLAATNVAVDANGAAIGGLQTDVATNTSDISDLQDFAVQYDGTSYDTITLDGAGGTTITNVANGALSATSTDAVNGAQLFATNEAVADLDGRVGVNETNIASNTTAISNLSTQIGGQQANIDDLDDRVTVNEGDIANLDGRVTVNEGDIASIDGRVTVNEGDIASLDGRLAITEGDITTLDGRVTTVEGDVANLDTQVTNNATFITEVQAQVDNVPVGYVSDADGFTPSTVPTNTAAFFGATPDPVRVTNVAAGTLSASSTDAVNGAQLAATNDAVAMNRSDIDQNTADITAVSLNLQGSTVVAVQYSDPDSPTLSNGGTVTQDVTLVGINSGQAVQLHNVASGTLANDAVNLGQLQAGLSDVLADSMTYTDQRFSILSDSLSAMSFDLENLRDEAFAGTAGAMAVAGIPQTMETGRMMVGGAVGHYRGETAFAIGMSTSFSDGQGVIKAGGTLDTHGKGGFSAGAGFSF